MNVVSKKVIIIGNFMVGKSSLVNRYVHNRFSEIYLTTLGVRVDKKIVARPEKEVHMIIWDIAGEVSQLQVPKSYYLGAHGVIYVFDLTRERTYINIKEDMEVVGSLLPEVPIMVAANKVDLVDEEELARIQADFPLVPDFICSAKNGYNIEPIFEGLADAMVKG